jgi:hypothetical protein
MFPTLQLYAALLPESHPKPKFDAVRIEFGIHALNIAFVLIKLPFLSRYQLLLVLLLWLL